MLDNVDLEKLKKNSFRLVGTLAISSILAFNISGCVSNNNYYSNYEDEYNEEYIDYEEDDNDEVKKAPCTINISGEEAYYKEDGDVPHFTLFYIDEDKKPHLYSCFECDEAQKETELSVGHYLLFSEDIGEIEFDVDNIDSKYTINVNYSNKKIEVNSIGLNINNELDNSKLL